MVAFKPHYSLAPKEDATPQEELSRLEKAWERFLESYSFVTNSWEIDVQSPVTGSIHLYPKIQNIEKIVLVGRTKPAKINYMSPQGVEMDLNNTLYIIHYNPEGS